MKAKDSISQISFDFGEKVEYSSRLGKDEGMVVGITLRPGSVSYAVTWSDKIERWHYACELIKK